MQIYLDRVTNNHLIVAKKGEVKCHRCNKSIENIAYLFMYLRNSNSDVFLYCDKCKIHPEIHYVVKVVGVALIADKPTKSSILLKLKAPEFSTSRLNSWEAADPEYDKKNFSETRTGYKVIDRAYACKDANFSIQADAKTYLQIKNDLDETDRKMCRCEADSFLLELKDAEILENRFELEDQRNHIKKLR